MSMAEVIKLIEREALREAQSREIGGRNGKPMIVPLWKMNLLLRQIRKQTGKR